MSSTEAEWETCVDCNSYDDVTRSDTFMMKFEDDLWLCGLCAEERGL